MTHHGHGRVVVVHDEYNLNSIKGLSANHPTTAAPAIINDNVVGGGEAKSSPFILLKKYGSRCADICLQH